MMRELKFRAWDKATKRYWNVDGLSFDKGKLVEVYLENYPVSFEGNENCKQPGDVILEQYTGLKDRNGKEIYDGDIIRDTEPIATNKSSTYQVFYKVDFAKFEVAPIDGKIDILSGYFNYASMGNYEVIGNIHENKELLEA